MFDIIFQLLDVMLSTELQGLDFWRLIITNEIDNKLRVFYGREFVVTEFVRAHPGILL